MTAPRMPLFQRKGAPPMGKDASKTPPAKGTVHPEGSTQDNATDPPGGGDGASDPVVCPNCQCQFNPKTGDVIDMPPDDMNGAPPDLGAMDPGPAGEGTELGAKLKQMMGGQ